MRAAFISTWQTECGIATYTQHLKDALELMEVHGAVLPIDRPAMAAMTRREIVSTFAELSRRASGGDVVHLQHEFGVLAGPYGLAVSLASLRAMVATLDAAKVPLFITWHTEPPAGGPPRRPRAALGWLRGRVGWSSTLRVIERSPLVVSIAHTETTRTALVSSGLHPGRIVVIPHGSRTFDPGAKDGTERLAIRARYGIPADATLLAIFGFVERYKGYRTALDAMERLSPAFHLVVAGGPHPLGRQTEAEHIVRWIEAHPNLAGRIHLTGYLREHEARGLLNAADVCLAPYNRRPTLSASGAITAAIASGRPVVASAIPAFADIWNRSRCLYLVPPEDPGALADAIERIQGDARLRLELSTGARQFCAEYSWPAVARAHAAAYHAAIERGRQRAAATLPNQLPGTR